MNAFLACFQIQFVLSPIFTPSLPGCSTRTNQSKPSFDAGGQWSLTRWSQCNFVRRNFVRLYFYFGAASNAYRCPLFNDDEFYFRIRKKARDIFRSYILMLYEQIILSIRFCFRKRKECRRELIPGEGIFLWNVKRFRRLFPKFFFDRKFPFEG